MLFRPNGRTAIRADVLAKSASHRRQSTIFTAVDAGVARRGTAVGAECSVRLAS
jgi:hypothetical protein